MGTGSKGTAGGAAGGRGPGGGEAVELSVDVVARPATVWRCVTQSDLLSRWLAAAVTLDPKVGGAVRIDFARYGTVVEGVVEEVRPGEALAFSWGVSTGRDAASMPVGSTRVSIRLAEIPTGTRVTLRHDGLPSAQSRRDHGLGWAGYLGGLAGVAPVVAVEGGPEALWDEWFAAWAETDAAKRDASVARRVADDATFTDVHVDCRGRSAISAWMGQCQGIFPGVRVVREGDVRNLRGRLLVRWVVTSPDGQRFGGGTNRGLLGPDGRLREVEAFWDG